jgi:hypothetical protein
MATLTRLKKFYNLFSTAILPMACIFNICQYLVGTEQLVGLWYHRHSVMLAINARLILRKIERGKHVQGTFQHVR